MLAWAPVWASQLDRAYVGPARLRRAERSNGRKLMHTLTHHLFAQVGGPVAVVLVMAAAAALGSACGAVVRKWRPTKRLADVALIGAAVALAIAVAQVVLRSSQPESLSGEAPRAVHLGVAMSGLVGATPALVVILLCAGTTRYLSVRALGAGSREPS